MKETINQLKRQRILEGVVVSARTDKTRIVEVTRSKSHALYHKRYKVARRYAVHDEKNESQTGDKVVIIATRPLSRTKRWRFLSKVS